MISYYFRLALRSLSSKPFSATISIVGLAIGLAAYILLSNYTHNEANFDSFHRDADHIYRVESYFEHKGRITDSWATSSFGYAPAMKNEFPEVKDIVRVNNYDCERVVRYNDVIYREPRVVFADSNFFSFFSFPLLSGSVNRVLQEPNSIVISERAAKKYFGQGDPIGKVLHISTLKSKYDCAVTGVFKDFPANSSLKTDLIMSYLTTKPWERQSWYMHYAYTYVKTDGPQQARAIASKFPALAEKFKTDAALKEHKWGVNMVPLTAIHLNPVKPYEVESKGSATAIRILSIMALVILLVSWINYINIFISRALERAGEIGIRKLTGAANKHILLQFVTEALLVNIIALLVFLVLIGAAVILADRLSIQSFLAGIWSKPYIWRLSIEAFLAGTLITGCIPAFVLKNIDSVRILKNKMSFNSGLGNNLRNGLIVFQYASSVVLLVAALTIYKQMHFMQSQDLGIATGQTLVFQTPPKMNGANNDDKILQLTRELKGEAVIRSLTRSSDVPGKIVGFGMGNRRAGDPDSTTKMCEMVRIDYDFIPSYNLSLIEGRNFSRSYPADTTESVILTENSMKLFGFRNAGEAVNGYINLEGHGDKKFKVIAVAKDYHQLSLKEGYRPIVLMIYNPWKSLQYQYVSVKLTAANPQVVIKQIAQKFRTYFPESSFDYFFLNDRYNRQYHEDARQGQMVMFFSVLALFIVCLGLIGVSSFMLLKRRKEIGVRKVIGAGVFDILKLLNLHFLKMLLIAFCIAVPVAWLTMYSWLQDYAYRTSIGIYIFIWAGGITVLITMITVTCQAFKTANTRPVTILRYD